MSLFYRTAVNSYTVGRSPVRQLVLDGFFIVNGRRIMVARVEPHWDATIGTAPGEWAFVRHA
jgi:hypothetical protein